MLDKENWKNRDGREFYEILEQFGKLGRLRIWIIYVLSDGPKNGIEIIDAIEKKHEAMHESLDGNLKGHQHHDHPENGKGRNYWKPLPGSIYPMLKKMVKENLISKMEDGRYKLTSTGQNTVNRLFIPFQAYRYINQDINQLENVLTEINVHISYLENSKKENLADHQAQIKNLIKRLQKIEELFQKG